MPGIHESALEVQANGMKQEKRPYARPALTSTVYDVNVIPNGRVETMLEYWRYSLRTRVSHRRKVVEALWCSSPMLIFVFFYGKIMDVHVIGEDFMENDVIGGKEKQGLLLVESGKLRFYF